MAGNIKKIVLQNFKAFNGVNEIDLEGKHLLLYGENGSGKSSIYWGLYTLLQSITKDSNQTDKYFDFNHEENLINRDYLIKLDETRGYGNYTVDVGKNVQIESALMKPVLKGENIIRNSELKSKIYVFYPHIINEKK